MGVYVLWSRQLRKTPLYLIGNNDYDCFLLNGLIQDTSWGLKSQHFITSHCAINSPVLYRGLIDKCVYRWCWYPPVCVLGAQWSKRCFCGIVLSPPPTLPNCFSCRHEKAFVPLPPLELTAWVKGQSRANVLRERRGAERRGEEMRRRKRRRDERRGEEMHGGVMLLDFSSPHPALLDINK